MKKILTIVALSAIASSAMAQGLLNWNTAAGSGSQIRYGSDPLFGTAAGTVYNGSFTSAGGMSSRPLLAGIYVGPAGSAESALALVATSVRTVGTSGPSMGNVTGMTSFAVPNHNFGSTITLQIRAWSGDSYGQGIVAGKSGVTQLVLGGPSPNPAAAAWSLAGVGSAPTWNAVAPTGAGALQGFTLSIVPEPASASLLGLGLASLLIFRRRK